MCFRYLTGRSRRRECGASPLEKAFKSHSAGARGAQPRSSWGGGGVRPVPRCPSPTLLVIYHHPLPAPTRPEASTCSGSPLLVPIPLPYVVESESLGCHPGDPLRSPQSGGCECGRPRRTEPAAGEGQRADLRDASFHTATGHLPGKRQPLQGLGGHPEVLIPALPFTSYGTISLSTSFFSSVK